MANLPSSLFEDIAYLNPNEGLALSSQRGSARHPYHSQAVITRPGHSPSDDPDDVVVQDISPGGISFIGPHAMKPGQKFSIWLKRRHGTLVAIECFVEHCGKPKGAKGNEEGFFIGCSFVRIVQAVSIKG